MTTVNREQEIEFACFGCCSLWFVEGRFNAEGKFEPVDDDDVVCIECDCGGEPRDQDVEVA